MRQLKFRIRWQREDGKVFTQIFEWDNLPSIKYLDGETISVDQFTGLKDKNGKDIYEGDIVRTNDKYSNIEVGEVYMSNYGSWCIRDLYEDDVDINGYTYVGDGTGKRKQPDFLVIGNIYENPELLNNK